MKQYPDYKYKPRRKPKNPLPNAPINSNLPLHNQTSLHNTTSPTAINLNNMMSSLQSNLQNNPNAVQMAAAVASAVASANHDPTQSSNPLSNPLSAQSLLNLGQNLNAFNLRDFPVLFPGMNSAVSALSNNNKTNTSQSNPVSMATNQYGFNNSLLNNNFLNPIYSSAKQTQLLNALNSQQKKSSLSPNTNSYSANRTSPVYPSSSISSSSTTSTPTLAQNNSNLLQLTNNDAYLAALHQQFLQQQQQFLMNNTSNQQFSNQQDEVLSNYLNNQQKQNSNTNSSPLSIDNLVKKQKCEKDEIQKKTDGSDDETIEDNLDDDEEDGDFNEEISNLLEKQNQNEANHKEIKQNGNVNSLKRSINSVLNERIIDNNNNNNDLNDKKQNDHSDPPAKHFKSNHVNDQFDSNDLKNSLTTTLFNSLRACNLSPSNSALIDNMKHFISQLPNSNNLLTNSNSSSKLNFLAENYLAKSLTQNNSVFSSLSNEIASHQNQDLFSPNLKPHLVDYNASSTASNFLEFYSQLLLKQANGRTNLNSTENFDNLHNKSSLIL